MLHKILAATCLGLLFNCSNSKMQSGSDAEESSKQILSVYDSAQLYIDFDSDSLLIEKGGVVEDFMFEFGRRGSLVREEDYGGGDCNGRFKIFKLENTSLVINKNSCGEYGFGNAQYLIAHNSLLVVRKYSFKYRAAADGILYDVSEAIYKFDQSKVELKERRKSVKEWRVLSLKGIPFENKPADRQVALKEFKSELKKQFKVTID